MSLRTQPLTVPEQIQDIYEKLRKLHPPTNVLQLIQNAIDNNPCDCGCTTLPGSKSFFEAGTIGIEASNELWYPPFPLTIRSIRATAATSTGLNTIDINVNGTTIFTDQTHRPQITSSGSNVTALASGIDLPIMNLGDYLSFDVDEGNGEDLSIEIGYVVECDALGIPTVGTSPSRSSSYLSTILADSPFAYWRLGESSGTTMVDSSGNGRDGTYTNTPTLGQTGALVGDSNTAVRFVAASSHYASVPLDLSGTNQVTMEFWLKGAVGPGGSGFNQLAFEFTSNYNGSTGGFIINPSNGNGFNPAVRGNAGYNSWVIDPAPLGWSTDFHHYVVLLDKSLSGTNPPECKVYVDGAQVALTIGVNGAFDNTNNFANDTLYFACRGGTSLFYDCTLDEVAIYTTILTSSQILAHYRAGTI